MTNPVKTSRPDDRQPGPVANLFEWIFGNYLAFAALPAGAGLLHVATTYHEVWFSFGSAILIGLVGFMLCLISIGTGVEWLAEHVSGRRKKRLPSDGKLPESSWHDFVSGILMLVTGILVIMASVFLYNGVLGETSAIITGLVGFFLARYSLDLFASAAFGPFLRWLWSHAWVQYSATGIMFLVLLYVMFDAYRILAE